jgi:hypothetical protein
VKVSLDEFAGNVEAYFERATHDNETIVVESKNGEAVILKALDVNGRERTEEDYETFLSSFGSWSDVDVDILLKDIYESRQSSRPPVEL